MKINYSIFYTIILFLFSMAIYAQETPQILLQPVDQTVCEGDSVGFVTEAIGMGELKYQWQKDGVDIPDENDSIYVNVSVSISDTGAYRCVVANGNGSDTTDPAVLSIDYILATYIYGPYEVENFDTALFSVEAIEGHTYEFIVSQGTVIETADTAVIVEWGEDEVGYVKVLESNESGCYGDTVSRLVIVGNVVPFFLTQPVSQTICFADSVNFEATAAGTSDLHYQWQLNGEDILRETSSVLALSNAELEDEGDYRCIVTNTVGADTSEIATLDIDYVEPAEIYGANIADEGDTIVYSIVSEEGHSYDFSVAGGTELSSTDTSMTVLWENPGIMYVNLVETNILGCDGDTVMNQVLVFGEGMMVLFLEQPESQGVCVNDSLSFMVEAAGYPELIYQWQKNGVDIENANDSILSIPNAQFDDDAAYQCIVSNDFGTDTSDMALLVVDEITPSNILGPQQVAEFEIVLYSVAQTEGHIYDFEVEGGNIIETTPNTITVHWGGTGYGKVRLLESIENSCIGDWVELEIYVGTVGIETDNNEEKIKVYPNPVSNFVTIELKGQNIVRLYDIIGNLILEEQFKDVTRLDISHLDQGLYLYRIDDRTGRLIKR